MSKISALDFAKNVEQNRQSLINHCLENGKSVSSAASLSEVVTVNNTIENGQNGFKVEFRDIDGTLLAPVQYVQAGGSATVPSTNPTFDSDYLEFDYWAVSGGDSLSNITRDTLVMPQYKTKLDSNLGQRPTYLVCYFGSNQLSPTLQIGGTRTNTYVDWGDGTAAQQITTNTIQHTYASEGRYVITLYGDSYSLGGNTSAGVFTSNTFSMCLYKAYLGEKIKSTQSMFYYSKSLRYAVINSNATQVAQTMFAYCWGLENLVIPNNVTATLSSSLENCYKLTHLIIPSTVTSLVGVSGCNSLVDLVIPNSVTSVSGLNGNSTLKSVIMSNLVTIFGNNMFAGCRSLENIEISNSVTFLGNLAFDSCSSLKSLVIPSSLTTFGNGMIFSGCVSLSNITLYSNFDSNINLNGAYLSDECFIDIANKLKDNTGLSAKVITFNQAYATTRMKMIYLDSNGDQVPYGTTGAVSLLAFIQNKNWTVAFS